MTRSAVGDLTHDPKLDDPALVAALATAGVLRRLPWLEKTHAARRVRLGERGVSAAGLDVCAARSAVDRRATPAEIGGVDPSPK